ncbi:MAG TPA: hypothetical protein VGR71_11755 [Nitrospira sp.]|nr:hypothetical protein [Nitrospira sp.]
MSETETRGFMYLELYVDPEDNHVRAVVTKSGNLRHSVGGENSRMSAGPVAVFAIDGFDGLGVITTEDLLAELLRRETPEWLITMLGHQLSKSALLSELELRMRNSR